ncbi:glutathionylspermidine synthase family protein [Neoroseomonas oryzicola]|uniref:Glutathionylspermidine synthase family protein n=1 Tax=Neoroseomonas oryzicola TaxID=535904 RepID=A0A9X9WN71_9PROT|nr:glutathionylspermidine synthase family protein [Neoroseomonas oryzicola]MBR0661781.1 glutathionylspermidine synthase family protein [Neoroseomonas oryzicola]NKE17955.1 glutathionylspermidine synthase family protein [Neoroseomonas oryzicola]
MPSPAITRRALRRDDAFPLRAEALGFTFHTPDGREYWARDACYAVTPEAVATMEAAARELNGMIAAAVDRVVARGDYAAFGFTPRLAALVEDSHRLREPSLYGRFDFRLDPADGSVKLYEFNAETPAALLEAATVQLAWFEETPDAPGSDQWNAIDDALVARWPRMGLPRRIHFAAERDREDEIAQVAYLMATARAAGHEAEFLPVDDISWQAETGFVTPDGAPLAACFKLYPWDWLDAEEGGRLLPLGRTRWIEPARRMLHASKAILVTLWEMFPRHPLLLPASLDRAAIDGPAIGKPALGLEGWGMTVEGTARDESTEVAEGLPPSPTIWQQWAPLPGHATPKGLAYPVMGVWMVGDEPAGLGIREGDDRVTTFEDRFVPHVIL